MTAGGSHGHDFSQITDRRKFQQCFGGKWISFWREALQFGLISRHFGGCAVVANSIGGGLSEKLLRSTPSDPKKIVIFFRIFIIRATLPQFGCLIARRKALFLTRLAISGSSKSSNRNNIKFEKHCNKMARSVVAKPCLSRKGCSELFWYLGGCSWFLGGCFTLIWRETIWRPCTVGIRRKIPDFFMYSLAFNFHDFFRFRGSRSTQEYRYNRNRNLCLYDGWRPHAEDCEGRRMKDVRVLCHNYYYALGRTLLRYPQYIIS